MERITEIFEKVVTFLTPFSWRRAISLLLIISAIALALYLTSCHVSRECRSFATIKVDRIDTIEYNSRYHQDYKYNYLKTH